MKRLITLLLTLCLFLSGCGVRQGSSGSAASAAPAAAIAFTDDDGREIRLDAPAAHIISLYSAHTENLFAIGAGETLVGGHATCIYPAPAAFLPVYDYTGDPETVIAAAPDLVLIRPFINRKAPDFVAALLKAGIPVVSLYPDSAEDFDDYIMKLAALVGKEAQAREQLCAYHAELDALAAQTAAVSEKRTVFFEATETKLRTVTADSLPARAIAIAGGVNLAADAEPVETGSTIASFGVEKVLENADRIDVYVSQRGAMNAGGDEQSIRERPGFDTVRAVRENHVYLMNEKIISSPTFRYVKGVREMARLLYPEMMDDTASFISDDPIKRGQYAELLMRALHLQMYLPSSSKYYQTEQKGHTYGLFVDVIWQNPLYDAAETAVYMGYMGYETAGNQEYFRPDESVTREELAHIVFLRGDFAARENHVAIADLGECASPKLVQILVDNGVFALQNGKFEPKRAVTGNEVLKALAYLN